MLINSLLTNIPYEILQGRTDIEIQDICWDSRRVKPNSLFICVKGRKVDRHEFAGQAVKNGAIVLIIDHIIDNIPDHITVIKVANSRETMAVISSRYFRNPSEKLKLIGITGTNGKTSVSYFISTILRSAHYATDIIGTIENTVGACKAITPKLNPTTPDSFELHSLLEEMLQAGTSHIVMEVTSSALSQQRVHGCKFEVGVFTNLTQDHLEEHGTMENYKNAKLKLFKMCKYGIVNTDDAIYKDIIATCTCDVLTYGIDSNADLKASNLVYSREGVSFIVEFNGVKNNVQLSIPSKFSVYNSLAAIGACYSLGLTMEQILSGFKQIKGVKGRFQVISCTEDFTVIVDYAHSPDSLENILCSVKELPHKNLIVVFGCGGDRDKTKRPIMGEIAGKYADFCIITSDNPRTESPLSIIEDIEDGISTTFCPYELIEDRKKAIFTALDKAKPEDVIVIAGKGHENYQIIGDKTVHFDDVEVVQEYFNAEKGGGRGERGRGLI